MEVRSKVLAGVAERRVAARSSRSYARTFSDVEATALPPSVLPTPPLSVVPEPVKRKNLFGLPVVLSRKIAAAGIEEVYVSTTLVMSAHDGTAAFVPHFRPVPESSVLVSSASSTGAFSGLVTSSTAYAENEF